MNGQLCLFYFLVFSFYNEIEICKTNVHVYIATYYLLIYSKSAVTIDFEN